ncbi:hypothetical protein VTK26DRAFT_4109 [Humicola hyalothermophila]
MESTAPARTGAVRSIASINKPLLPCLSRRDGWIVRRSCNSRPWRGAVVLRQDEPLTTEWRAVQCKVE